MLPTTTADIVIYNPLSIIGHNASRSVGDAASGNMAFSTHGLQCW
jgi:hypothetical protein